MKIALVGVFAQTHSTNVAMADALQALGHDVARIPYRDVGQQRGPEVLHLLLAKAAELSDAMVICKGFGGDAPPLVPDAIRQLKCRTVYWCPDTVDIHGMTPVDYALACNAACATSLASCRAFRQYGHREVSQIFEGYDPKVFHVEQSDPQRRGVVFVGSLTPHRAECLAVLEGSGIEVERPALFGHDLSERYANSKVALNFVHGEIFSDRVFQVMASGGCLLTEECQDLLAAFRPSVDLETFKGLYDLPETARLLLADSKRCARMARLGAEAVKRFTWVEQMRKLIRVLKGNGSIADGAFK